MVVKKSITKKSFIFILFLLLLLLFFVPFLFTVVEKDKSNYVLESKGLNVLVESCRTHDSALIYYFNYSLISKKPFVFQTDRRIIFYANCFLK